MANLKFNEAEKFLIKNFGEVRQLEEALQNVRTKYRTFIQEVIEEAQQLHPEFDFVDDQFKAAWADGSLIFARKEWGNRTHFPGFFIDGLRLERLSSEESDAPTCWVNLTSLRKGRSDRNELKRFFWQELPKVLSKEEMTNCKDDEGNDFNLIYWEFATKKEVLAWFQNDEGSQLRDRAQEHVALFARMLPVLENALKSVPVNSP